MKCVAIKGKKEFEIKEIEEPKVEEGKVKIHVLKTGICGSDLHYWVAGAPVGLVMGHEFCGTVMDAGNRSDLKVGDRVTALPLSPCYECEACNTGNIHYCLKTWDNALGLSLDNPGGLTKIINVREDMVLKVPDVMSDEEVALVEPVAVGYHAINLADIRVGEKVLVVGGGIIGLVSAMFAKKEGATKVIVSETNPNRGKKAVELGVADEWVNALDSEAMQKLGLFDKVIDCCGNTPAVSSALMQVKSGGLVVLVGVSMEPINYPSIIHVMHELKVGGAIAYTKEEFTKVIELIANKDIEVEKFISDIVPLADTQASYERLTSGQDEAIKIIVDPNL